LESTPKRLNKGFIKISAGIIRPRRFVSFCFRKSETKRNSGGSLKMKKTGFTPLETTGSQKKAMMFLTGFTPLKTIGSQKKAMMSLTGFSLIEVLVALFILGLGIAVLFNLFPLGWQALAYSRKLNAVSLLAQTKLEELKSQGAIESGDKSGKEGDLDWTLSTKPLKLAEGIEVIFVELDIAFNYKNNPEKQRFITYVLED